MARPRQKDLRVFGIAMVVVLSGLGVWQVLAGRSLPGFLLLGAAGYFLAGVVVTALLAPIYGPWMKLAFFLGQVMTKVLLSLCFVVAIVPIGLLRKLFRKDGLDRRLDGSRSSYWRERTGEAPDRERYERLF